MFGDQEPSRAVFSVFCSTIPIQMAAKGSFLGEFSKLTKIRRRVEILQIE